MPGNYVIMSLLRVYAIATTAILPFVCSKYCALFEFPTFPSAKTQYIFAVNTTIAFPFYLVNRSCRSLDNYTVQIYKSFTPACNVHYQFGKCQEPQKKTMCYCNHSANYFLFMKTIDKTDQGEWAWSATGDDLNTIAECLITFRIIANSRIINLTVDGKEEPQITLGRKNVLLICSWIKGDLPSTANLLVDNKLVNSSRSSGNISYQFSASPELSGAVIRCEADGSDKNMSTVVFISETRPVFLSPSFKSFDVRPGKTFNFTFSVRIHETEHLQCYLNKTKSYGVDSEISTMNVINCTAIQCAAESCDSKLLIQQNISKTRTPSSLEEKCVCYFGGSPPDLSLTVAMHNDVTDLGSWRLTVSNRDGTDHQDFFLLVMEDDKYHGDGFNLVTTLLLVTILAVAVCCIFTYIIHTKKSRQKIVGSAEPTQNSLSIHRVESKSQHHKISDIDVNNLLIIHKIDNSRDSGFLDNNFLTAQE